GGEEQRDAHVDAGGLRPFERAVRDELPPDDGRSDVRDYAGARRLPVCTAVLHAVDCPWRTEIEAGERSPRSREEREVRQERKSHHKGTKALRKAHQEQYESVKPTHFLTRQAISADRRAENGRWAWGFIERDGIALRAQCFWRWQAWLPV